MSDVPLVRGRNVSCSSTAQWEDASVERHFSKWDVRLSRETLSVQECLSSGTLSVEECLSWGTLFVEECLSRRIFSVEEYPREGSRCLDGMCIFMSLNSTSSSYYIE